MSALPLDQLGLANCELYV